jgi:hypothetical protein
MIVLALESGVVFLCKVFFSNEVRSIGSPLLRTYFETQTHTHTRPRQPTAPLANLHTHVNTGLPTGCASCAIVLCDMFRLLSALLRITSGCCCHDSQLLLASSIVRSSRNYDSGLARRAMVHNGAPTHGDMPQMCRCVDWY